ncbi:MAG: PHP domain-containing protein [Eubacteriales bacterium]|nr:PHP domain-containing protein [Eubacteriales bacterium]
MKYIDLHVHSTCSDGTYTPAQLVRCALEKHLAAFALTDHDTVDGLDEAFAAARGTDLEVISGIEFSTEFHGKDIHILGLDFNYKDPLFLTRIQLFQESRDIRNRKMIEKLQENGIDITWEKMESAFGDAVWTRAHFARYLKDHGYVREMNDAFSIYIGDSCPCFVPREKVTPAQAVRLVRQVGGIPILAHPLQYRLPESDLAALIQELKASGLLGIEAVYSTHSSWDEEYVRRVARKNHLCISGGSDFHGSNKPAIDLGCGKGNLKISYDLLKQLREAK